MNATSGIRLRRRRKKVVDIVRELDSFPKMPEDYKKHTGIGGLITVFMYMFMLWLILSEIVYYKESRIFNKFIPDVDFHDKLKIAVDITVAMRCHDIGADIVDATNQESRKFGKFKLEDTWFELSPNQKIRFQEVQQINSYFRDRYHAIRDILWKAGYRNDFNALPPRSELPDYPHDACRIIGNLELNKVAGNFHITLGKSLSVPGGHIHLQQLFPIYHANFSHRIDKFSFGDLGPAIINPLDSSIKIAANTSQIYKYFIEVISTDVDTSSINIKTYQYSVKDLSKFTDSHEMLGIFFKYDINPLKIIIREEEYTLLQLILRLCGCAGGLYIVTGLIKDIFEATILRRYFQATSVIRKFTTEKVEIPEDV